jgi:hypothetical protein
MMTTTNGSRAVPLTESSDMSALYFVANPSNM